MIGLYVKTLPQRRLDLVSINKIRKRAISYLGTYTPGSMKTPVDPMELLKICEMALRYLEISKPLRYKLKLKEDTHEKE